MQKYSDAIEILPLYDTSGGIVSVCGVVRYNREMRLFSIRWTGWEWNPYTNPVPNSWTLRGRLFDQVNFPTWQDALEYVSSLVEG